MNKRELIEKIAALSDDDDIVIALTFPKPEEGFTMGEEDSADESDSPNEDDEDGVDNEDGTTTEFYPIEDIDVEEFEDEDTKVMKKVAFINLELNDDDESDEDESEDDSPTS